jgi:prepilin-type N-terminal cleavage/methylation domain-containing protein
MLNMFTPKAPKCACSKCFWEEVPYYSLNTGALGHSNENEKNLKSRSKTKKFFGFTLAEVLITLGIIGVVSAMTIPALMKKCQKVVLANQAKKEYAMWTQVFKDILADNNTTSLSETELWGKIEVTIYDDANPTTNTAFWTELGKYVKISPSATGDTEEYYLHDDKELRTSKGNYPIYLANGSKLRAYEFRKTPYRKTDAVCSQIKELGGSMCSYVGHMFIDVNGGKGPNIWGRDIFEFYISDEGVLYPYGGKDCALYVNQTPIEVTTKTVNGFYTNESGEYVFGTHLVDFGGNSSYWKNYYNGTKEQNAKKYGYYRTGQLMEEGWKMNY